jgi:hypothetical protein
LSIADCLVQFVAADRLVLLQVVVDCGGCGWTTLLVSVAAATEDRYGDADSQRIPVKSLNEKKHIFVVSSYYRYQYTY